MQVKVVQSLGPNYLGVFSPREAAVVAANHDGAAQHAFTGRGALTTALAAAFAPLAHDSRSLVDFSPRGAHMHAPHACITCMVNAVVPLVTNICVWCSQSSSVLAMVSGHPQKCSPTMQCLFY